MEVRSVLDGDLPAIAAIAVANDDEDGADPRYVSHLCEHGEFLVALSDGRTVGYCGLRRVGGLTLLSDLFVDPAWHGGGVGRRLLDVAFGVAGDRSTFASRDPRAMSLYVRYGMIPRWPLLYLCGPPSPGTAGPGAPPPSRGIPGTQRAERVTAGTGAADARALDGCGRSADYAFWAGEPGV